ncbi:hypothetical protein MMC22_001232 [Lobaria immixta]|nr:hypothetical protein [Lobaria immixta]
MTPSNISRSQSMKERISRYFGKRIYGEPGIITDTNQANPTERHLSDLSQVHQACVIQHPAKPGFWQRFRAEFNAALDSRDTVKRSSTTWGRRRYRRRDSVPHRSASTPHRRRNPRHSSLRESSSVTRGRRYRREDSSTAQGCSSTGQHHNNREHSSPPQPQPRARSYHPASFATKPKISNPVGFVDLNVHPALRNYPNTTEIPLTDRTDPLDTADFAVPPSTNEMPLYKRTASKRGVDGHSHPTAPCSTAKHSIISDTTRWGDFISEAQGTPASRPASNQAAKVAAREPQSRGRSHGRSQSPAKFPLFPPAAHQTRAQSPRSRKPEADPTPSFPRTSNNQRPRGPVICQLCKGLSDPNISYPEVKRQLCSSCAWIAFGVPGQEQSREPSEEGSTSTTVPLPPQLPPTPPVKDFAGFNFAGSTVLPATPSSTGSQPKFEACSTFAPPAATATVEDEPPDRYRSSSAHVESSSTARRPRPPSSAYSCTTSGNKYKSNMGNPFTSPNVFNTTSPSSYAVERANNGASSSTGTRRKPVPPPPLPHIRTNMPVSSASSYITMSHTENFIPMPPSPIPEQHWEEEEDSPKPVNRRSSFYHFYDDVLSSDRAGGTRDNGKGKGKAREEEDEEENTSEWWD